MGDKKRLATEKNVLQPKTTKNETFSIVTDSDFIEISKIDDLSHLHPLALQGSHAA